jgi:hypothetical protein
MILADGAVTDPTPNNIAAVPSTNAKEATNYVKDNVDPELDSWEINMNNGLLRMHFTETIKFSSFSTGKLVLSSDVSTGTNVVAHLIGDKSVVVNSHADSISSDYTTIVIQLHKDDMDAIKNIPTLANNQDHSH